MQAVMDPRQMPREALETEVTTLRRRDHLSRFQAEALQRISNIAVQATSQTPRHLTGSRLVAFKQKVVQLSKNLVDAVVNIAEVGKNSVISAVRAMCKLALDIANFIYDNFTEIIATAALSFGICVLVFDTVILCGMVLSAAEIAAPAAAAVGGVTAALDFAQINNLAGF